MLGYDQWKRYYQLIENFDVYLHAKIYIFGYFGHAWPRPQKAIASTCRYSNVYLQTKNQHDDFFKDITLKRIPQYDWPKTFWGLTPDQEFCQIFRFLMESEKLKELSFCIVSGKSKWQYFQKNAKYRVFFPNFPQKLGSVTF